MGDQLRLKSEDGKKLTKAVLRGSLGSNVTLGNEGGVRDAPGFTGESCATERVFNARTCTPSNAELTEGDRRGTAAGDGVVAIVSRIAE